LEKWLIALAKNPELNPIDHANIAIELTEALKSATEGNRKALQAALDKIQPVK